MVLKCTGTAGLRAQVAEEHAGKKYCDDRQYHHAVVARRDAKPAKLPVQELLIAPRHVDLL